MSKQLASQLFSNPQPVHVTAIEKGNPNFQLSRHIKLNHTNIALLLQEVTQTYRKLTNYRTKCCYLSLLLSLLLATCTSFAFLNGRVFSVLGHNWYVTSDHSCCIQFHFLLRKYLSLSSAQLNITACIKNHTYFTSSVTTEHLYKSLFFKFCTNLSQVVLRRFYTERFLCNSISVALICVISSFYTNLKRQNSSDLLRIVSFTFQCRKLPRFCN